MTSVLTVACFFLRNAKIVTFLLTASSIAYYFYVERGQLAILMVYVIASFFFVFLEERLPIRKKNFTIVAVALLLVPLFYIKYRFHLAGLHIPIGLSFFTFQAIAGIIDIHKKEVKFNGSSFLLYLTYYPQLVAGPILRYDFFKSALKNHSINKANINEGILLIFNGLFKKVLIADTVNFYLLQKGFSLENSISIYKKIISMYLYGFQLYFDFAGYTDIALGTSLILGIRLCQNFNRPYLSHSGRDFWRRWHITLGAWIRDYIYIPLGGRTKYKSTQFAVIIITFAFAGIWHGVGINFLIWGLYWGLIIFFEQTTSVKIHLSQSLKVLITFNLIMFGWVFFRFNYQSIGRFFTEYTLSFAPAELLPGSICTLVLYGLHHLDPLLFKKLQTSSILQALFYSIILSYIASSNLESDFIYFSF